MLVQLSIRNLAVVASAEVAFDHGFHVLTGETGAGKSIIVDALSLIAGGRGAQDFIRHGAEKAEVEAMFEPNANHPVWAACTEQGIEADPAEGILIRRELTAAGKSVARVNGQLVNLSMLKQIGEYLINIHGQHEHQSLLRTDHHLGLLDSFAKDALERALSDYRQTYAQQREQSKRLKQLKENRQQQLQKVDLYQFQLAEIKAANLQPGEQEKLEEERLKLANAEKLFQAINTAYEALHENQAALTKLGKATSALEAIVNYDATTLQPLKEQLDTAFYQVEDVAFQLRDYREEIVFNPGQLDRIEQRLDSLSGLRKKYGESIEAIIAYGEQIAAELSEIEDFEQAVLSMEAELNQLTQTLHAQADGLTAIRKAKAEHLSAQITAQLRDLQMEKAQLQVSCRVKAQFDANGQDEIEFMFSANPGEPIKPLAKIASGGELSRVMLALKTIFATIEQIPVLVFDEVDTGVSGRAAQAIAEKLAWIAQHCQVFSITHLPQVACMADVHFLVKKADDGMRTFTDVEKLDTAQRADELARMLGGVEVTATTRTHAEEMLQLAVQRKQQWQ
jgi:DNA repair protein RecN (Recombination protein N)